VGRISKKLYWAGAGVFFLLILLISVAVVVPRIVDSAWLKETIRAEAAKQVHGALDFEKAALFLLPVPGVSLQQITFSIPGTAKVNLETLTVYPRLLSLLVGKIDIAKVVIETPDFSLSLPQQQEKKTDRGKAFSFSDVLNNASTKLATLLTALPGLNAGVHNGILRLFAGNDEIFLFKNINGSFAVSSNSLAANLSCTSNIWETLELQTFLLPGSNEGKGKISLGNINVKVLTDYFLQGKSPLLEGSSANLAADFAVSPETGLTADIVSSGSSFTALRENEKITARVANLKGNVQFADHVTAITLDDLTLSSPQVQLNGSYTSDRSIPHTKLDITAQNVNIKGVREVLPVFIKALYGDVPVVREIFDITRGGTILQASFLVEGNLPSDLAVFESMRIQGQVKDGEITLSDLGLDLQGVTGDVTVAEGLLEGKNLQAKLGNTSGSDGTFKIGLVQKEPTPFHLDLDLNADLSEVLQFLKKMVPKKQVLQYLSLIENVEGTSEGRLTLGESLESLTVRVEANKISGQAKYKPIPYPVSINGGRILYDGLKNHSFNLQGKVGNSTFSNYSSSMNFEGEPTIEVESGTFHLLLDEIFPWLASDKRLADDLKDIKTMTGIAEVTVKSIRGLLLQPANLQYELHCAFRNVDMAAAYLPGPLNIASGKAVIVPDKTIFENMQAILLDSSFNFSGVLQNYISGITNAEIFIADAEIGVQVNSWLSEQIYMPEEYIFRTPLLISRANVKWTREELLDLQGDFAIKDGPIFYIDVLLNPEELLLRNLSLKNEEERAKIRLVLRKREIDAEFQGSLSKTTIDNILLHNDVFPEAWINGDIKFKIDMDSPATSFASGNLDGGNFIFPWKPDKPIRVHSFSLSAADKTLTLNSGEAVFDSTIYEVKGQASLTPELLSMDFDAKTDTVELDTILRTLKDEGKEGKETKKGIGKYSELAVRSNINLHADSLQYNKYTWTPFEAQITYENNALGIEVLKAELCNISTPGKISFHGGQIAMNFGMEANEQEFHKVLLCLEGGTQQMTGILNLKANISGHGTKETLFNSLEADLQYSSKDGYVYHDAHLAKLLSLLSVNDMYRGKIPDLRTAGFPYDSLIVKGTMQNGILTIGPAKLEAPVMQIVATGTIDLPRKRLNLAALVAPLQTVNKIQEMLPLVKHIIPSSIVALPVEIKGDFSNIKLRILSMTGITTRIFDIMVDALSTPVRVLEGTPQK
jgi:hypothetical protein